MQSLRQIDLNLWKIGAIQNRYSIVVYGVMSESESKNPRPLSMLQFDTFFIEFQGWLKRDIKYDSRIFHRLLRKTNQV